MQSVYCSYYDGVWLPFCSMPVIRFYIIYIHVCNTESHISYLNAGKLLFANIDVSSKNKLSTKTNDFTVVLFVRSILKLYVNA